MSDCSCREDWRLLALDLKTGRPQTYLSPTDFSFEQVLNDVGNASVTLAVRDYNLSDVWPHSTAIAFLRISGDGATPSVPKCEFIGIGDGGNPTSNGTGEVGLKSIEEYLDHRIIHGDQDFTGIQQTILAKTLVDMASDHGIPLFASAETSATLLDRSYLDTDQKKILEAVTELTEAIDGPDYERSHDLQPDGTYATTLIFKDRVGSTDPVSIYSTLGATEYGLSVDSSNHVTRIIGVGSDPNLVSDTGIPADSIYPLFERSVSWSDIQDQDQLDDQTAGELANNVDPTAIPSITLAGLELAPQLTLGGTIDLHLDHGAVRYHGAARLISKAWSAGSDGPTTVTLSMVPLDNATSAILNAQPENRGCCR